MIGSFLRAALTGIFGLAFPLSLAAQQERFQVQSRLVVVPVTVTDEKGRTVEGLEASDFLILDNGRPQPAAVDTFATGVAPIALVVAVQSSGISSAVLAKVRKIGSMIEPLVIGQRGCAALLSFDERVRWLENYTNDPDALVRAFRQLRPTGEKTARMLDAVREASDRLLERRNVRRVLLLISESRDRGSETDLAAAILALQQAGVLVYAATYSAFTTAFTAKPEEDKGRSPGSAQGTEIGGLLGGIHELARLGMTKTTQALTESTGGAAFSFTRQKGLEDSIEKLAADLHTQYLLSFTPQAPAAGYHRLEVRIARGGNFHVRSRPGYWAQLQ